MPVLIVYTYIRDIFYLKREYKHHYVVVKVVSKIGSDSGIPEKLDAADPKMYV